MEILRGQVFNGGEKECFLLTDIAELVGVKHKKLRKGIKDINSSAWYDGFKTLTLVKEDASPATHKKSYLVTEAGLSLMDSYIGHDIWPKYIEWKDSQEKKKEEAQSGWAEQKDYEELLKENKFLKSTILSGIEAGWIDDRNGDLEKHIRFLK